MAYGDSKKQVRKREKRRLKWLKEYQKQNPEAVDHIKALKTENKARQKGGKNSIARQVQQDYNARELARGDKMLALSPEIRARLKAAQNVEQDAHYAKVYKLRAAREALNPWNATSWYKGEYNKENADKYMAAADASRAHAQSRKSAIWDGTEFNEAGRSIIDAPTRSANTKAQAIPPPRLDLDTSEAQATSAAPTITTPKETSRKVIPRVSARIKQKSANRKAGIRT